MVPKIERAVAKNLRSANTNPATRLKKLREIVSESVLEVFGKPFMSLGWPEPSAACPESTPDAKAICIRSRLRFSLGHPGAKLAGRAFSNPTRGGEKRPGPVMKYEGKAKAWGAHPPGRRMGETETIWTHLRFVTGMLV